MKNIDVIFGFAKTKLHSKLFLYPILLNYIPNNWL